MSDVSTIDTWANDLLSAVNDALATTDEGAISRAFVTYNLPVLDCCPQLTVDVRGVQREVTSPQNPIAVQGHAAATQSLWLASLFATVVRCVPVIQENTLPDPAAMAATARVLNQDLMAVWNYLLKLVRSGDLFDAPCAAVYIDAPVPLPGSGGCGGWVFPVRPAIDGYDVTLPS